jgi:hypothetical protein
MSKLVTPLWIKILFAIPILLLSGCFKTINEGHSQFRGEAENQNRLLNMYAMALPLCDGNSIANHKLCVSNIRKEYSARFADRFKAHYTASSAESLFATAIVLSYLSDEQSKNSSSDGTSSPVKTRLCKMQPPIRNPISNQFSFAIDLAQFANLPVKCS